MYARAWTAADSINARVRLSAENDRLQEERALLREERKRLGNYIFPRFCRTIMMAPSSIDRERVHHELELIEKGDQPPALA